MTLRNAEEIATMLSQDPPVGVKRSVIPGLSASQASVGEDQAASVAVGGAGGGR